MKFAIEEINVSRFWSKVEITPTCWLWKAAVFRARWGDGYGAFAVRTPSGKFQNRAAHRISWAVTNGEIPEGLFVLHSCDNRYCVRPDHLFLGTHQENMDDMVKKGRQMKGSNHYLHTNPEKAEQFRGVHNGNAKLTDEQVNYILENGKLAGYADRPEGKSPRELALRFGVNRCTIQRILRGDSHSAFPNRAVLLSS